MSVLSPGISLRIAVLFAVTIGLGCASISFALSSGDEPIDIESLKFSSINSEAIRQASVRKILKGSDLMMWVATNQGVYRFDGYDVKLFQNSPDQEDSLISNSIYELHVDHLGRFWVGTVKGISRYNFETEIFENFLLDPDDTSGNLANHVNQIINDGSHVYASSEKGFIYRFDEASGVFEALNDESFGIIKSMAKSSEHVIVGSSNGLFRLHLETHVVEDFSFLVHRPDLNPLNYINDILVIDADHAWVASSLLGPSLVNFENQTIKQLFPDSAPNEYYTNTLAEDSTGRIWAGHSGGISIFTSNAEIIANLSLGDKRYTLPSHTGVTSLYFDTDNNIWVGTQEKGVWLASKLKKFHKFLPFYDDAFADELPIVSAITKDQEGNILIGYGSNGIDIFDDQNRQIGKLRHEKNSPDSSLSSQSIFNIYQDSVGIFWIGSYIGGLKRFDPKSGEITTYQHVEDDRDSIVSDDIRDIVEDENGDLWVVTHGAGISLFEKETRTFKNLQRDFVSHSPEVENWPICLHYGKDKNLYFGTYGGLYKYDPKSNRTTRYIPENNNRYSLSNEVINDLTSDQNGDLWIATNSGINRLNPTTQDIERFVIDEGYGSEVVVSIICDENSNVWAGTNSGLIKLYPESGEVESYTSMDGIAGDRFARGAVYKDVDGVIYFGTNSGLFSFEPDEIRKNKTPVEVILTDFKIFNQSVRLQDDETYGTNGKSISQAQSVTVQYEQKSIEISYVALSFIHPERNQYAYKLEGFDENWVFAENEHRASYTNLAPGQYTFTVKASNSDGIWNEQGSSIEIYVEAPYWKKAWFKGLLILLLIAIPTIIFFWRIHSIKVQKRVLESTVASRTQDLRELNDELEQSHQQISSQNNELMLHREHLEELVSKRTKALSEAKEKAEQSDRLKSAFLANVSHEIRTPMNAIMGFWSMIDDEDITREERSEFGKIIQKSGRNLIGTIDDILYLSKIESEIIEIDPSACDLNAIVEEEKFNIEKTYSDELENVVISHVAVRSEDATHAMVDELRVKHILSSLLSNAAKFTEAGTIECCYYLEHDSLQQEWIVFRVKDTGVGIPEEDVDGIFDRFRKANHQTTLFQGNGLGLAICKRLVEFMKGSISVHSIEGEGSTFEVRIPFIPVADSEKHLDAVPQGEEFSFEDLSVLVVEDEKSNYQYIELILSRMNIKCEWVETAEGAIEILKDKVYDFILMDIGLPGKNGYQLFDEVKTMGVESPIIAQTAFALEEDQTRCLKAGFDNYIAKPYSEEQLNSVIKKTLTVSA